MHGRFLRAGVAAFVAFLGTEFGTTIFRLVVEEANLVNVRLDAVGNFFAQPLIEGVHVVIVVRRLLVVARGDLAFLGVARDLLLGERAHHVRLTLGIKVLVLGKLVITCSTLGARRRVEIGDALRIEVVEGVLILFLLSHTSFIPLASGNHEFLD
jgi:hypothetical protein